MACLQKSTMSSFACISNLRCIFSVCANSRVNSLQKLVSSVRFQTTGVTQTSNMQNNTLQEKPMGQKKLGRAMRIYLERANQYDEFMKREIAEYEIGKRHLANMMGEDPENFTQQDIDRSIEYLFPSGLYDKEARPMLRHPTQLYPSRKEAEFDESGRPYNMFFYTRKPNYYSLLYDMMGTLLKLNSIESMRYERGLQMFSEEKFDIVGKRWISLTGLQKKLQENISHIDYKNFVLLLERIANHTASSAVSSLILQYCETRKNISDIALPPFEYDETGRPFIKVERCQRKNSVGEVIVRGNGKGQITINGQSILYFSLAQHREQVMFPLIFTKMADKVDVVATVAGGGPTGQSGAIRWGIAWALRNFVDKSMLEKMRIAGLLTRDWRRRERKKFGQAGARKKFTWRKR